MSEIRVTLTSTATIAHTVNGTHLRLWEGTTDKGSKVQAWIAFIGLVDEKAPPEELRTWESELVWLGPAPCDSRG